MLKFATNLTFMYTEVPFLERIARAGASGFRYIEFHNPYPFCEDLQAIVDATREHGVRVIHFNLPGGDWDAGERGIAVHPGRTAEFRAGVVDAVAIAERLGCRQLNCPIGYPDDAFTPIEQRRALVENLRFAAQRLLDAGIMLLIEPLNPITHPGYPLVTTRSARQLLDEVSHPNLLIQYDFYQMQRSEGELIETVRQNLGQIGYIQLADNPGRHEPGTGEINFRFLLRELQRLNYQGFVSLEYSPSDRTEDSLAWLAEYGLSLGA